MQNFSGKNVFVAGGTSGINLGVADAYAEAGARVSVMSRNPERVAEAVGHLKRHHKDVGGYVGDVRDMKAVEAALRAAHSAFGSLFGGRNYAGNIAPTPRSTEAVAT